MDQRDLRGLQAYPTCDVILLCVLFMIIMRFYHADSTPLRIKALDFFVDDHDGLYLGVLPRRFPQAVKCCSTPAIKLLYIHMASVAAVQPQLNFGQQEPSASERKCLDCRGSKVQTELLAWCRIFRQYVFLSSFQVFLFRSFES